MNKRQTQSIAYSAMFLALIICIQAFASPMGQYAVGSAVNLILISSVLICGIYCALTISILSPLIAFFLGIGVALPPVIPIIMLGNSSLVLVWFMLMRVQPFKRYAVFPLNYIISIVIGATVKFLILYFGIVRLLIPLLGLSEKQTALLSVSFSYPQLLTALIGGALSATVVPSVLKILRMSTHDSITIPTPQPESNQSTALKAEASQFAISKTEISQSSMMQSEVSQSSMMQSEVSQS